MEQDKIENEGNGALKRVYTNCFRIGHSAYKFVFDFGQLAPDGKKKCFHTRVITGPDTAKAFVDEFGQTIRQHEEQFGRITRSD